MRVRVGYLVPAILLLAIGTVWTLQGAGLLRGSPMTSQPFWLGAGVVGVLAGLVLGYVGLAGRR